MPGGECCFQRLQIGEHAVTAEPDHPVVHQGTDGHHEPAMSMGFPHLDRRPHGGFGHKGDHHIHLPTHVVVPLEHRPALGIVVVQRILVVGQRIIHFRGRESNRPITA